MPAKLPEELIRKRPRTVADLEPGSEAFVPLYSIVVDLDRSVYLFRNAELESTDEKSVRVRRDDKGAYHPRLEGVNKQFDLKDLELYKPRGLVVPIESISGMADSK